MIVNKNLTSKEKKLIKFFLSHSTISKRIACQQVRHSYITKDVSPYYLIIEFHVDKTKAKPFAINPGYIISFDVLHDDGSVPACFNFHFTDNYISMLEVFNADSSLMKYDDVIIGKIVPLIWPHQRCNVNSNDSNVTL
jgi:hypothetical protein